MLSVMPGRFGPRTMKCIEGEGFHIKPIRKSEPVKAPDVGDIIDILLKKCLNTPLYLIWGYERTVGGDPDNDIEVVFLCTFVVPVQHILLVPNENLLIHTDGGILRTG